jgi:hypothetical protein
MLKPSLYLYCIVILERQYMKLAPHWNLSKKVREYGGGRLWISETTNRELMNVDGLVCVSGCNKMTHENVQSCSERCVEEAGSWIDCCFYKPWIASEKFTGQSKAWSWIYNVVYKTKNIRQLLIRVWGSSLFPVVVFRGKNWENLENVITIAWSFTETDTKLKITHNWAFRMCEHGKSM